TMFLLFAYQIVHLIVSVLAACQHHSNAIFQQRLLIHQLTEEAAAAADPRFASVTILHPATTADHLVELILKVMSETGSAFAVTFLEMDVVAVGRANQRHGLAWRSPEADV